MTTDPTTDDPSFEEEETGEYFLDDDESETTWEWDGDSWKQVE
jgi:hypothetical protein